MSRGYNTMLPVSLVGILMMSLSGATDIQDFDLQFGGTYGLLYHAEHRLLVAIHGNNCYFVNVPIGKEQNLVDDVGFIRNRLNVTENSLLAHIRSHSGLRLSSLEVVRDKFKDILADFHCVDKVIYEVDLFSDSATGVTSAPTAHPDAYPCLDRPNGAYPYPGDCSKFVQCVAQSTYVETCGPGLLFSPTTQTCLYPNQVTCG